MGVTVTCDVLVVDDDVAIRDVIVQTLTDEGYVVSEANDGQMALDAVKSNRPCVIVIDLMMPVLDGAEAIRRLKGNPATKAIRIVLMSAALSHRQPRPDVPADAVLPKPFDLAALCHHVRRQLALA